jgi:hypothetical protein
MRDQTALFLPGPAQIVPAEHKSNPLGVEYEMILREGKKFVLNIGAGATATRYPNCIEFERKTFATLTSSAMRIAFRFVMEFSTAFLRSTFSNIWRIRATLRPKFCVSWKQGGSLVIHTAFLQPLHEAPFHFYNATEHGVRSWFKDFDVEKCHVSPNFTVPFMLAFLLSQVLESVGAICGKEAREAVGQSTLRDWADFWRDRSKVPAVFRKLQNVPNELQSEISAGFELVARKP